MKITDAKGQQWQLVPVEPVDSVLPLGPWRDYGAQVWKEMLAAAPEPELATTMEPVATVKPAAPFGDTNKLVWANNIAAIDDSLVGKSLYADAEAIIAAKDAEIDIEEKRFNDLTDSFSEVVAERDKWMLDVCPKLAAKVTILEKQLAATQKDVRRYHHWRERTIKSVAESEGRVFSTDEFDSTLDSSLEDTVVLEGKEGGE